MLPNWMFYFNVDIIDIVFSVIYQLLHAVSEKVLNICGKIQKMMPMFRFSPTINAKTKLDSSSRIKTMLSNWLI
jgi:hypothetical protein